METLFFREKRLTALVLLVLLSAGLSAFLSIGRQEDPTITNLFATIVTPYPGADPERVEALVTEKIEQELRQIAEIDELKSVSRSGISLVTVELSSFISDVAIEQAWSEIRDALTDAALSFPAGVPEPEFDNDRTGAFTAISSLRARHDAVPLALVGRHAENLQNRLRAVTGTKLVERYGEPEEEIRVEIDPRRLAALGLTPQQVAATIAAADAKVSAGSLESDRSDFLVEIDGEIDGLDRIAAIPLTTSANGLVTRVGDIASLTKAAQEPPSSIAYYRGNRAVLVAAKMDNDLQVDVWTDRIRGVYTDFERTLPDGLAHEVLFDQSGYTFDRLADVGMNMAIGVSLVVAVLFFTLGARAALVVAMVLPVVTLASVATLNYLGISIHQMSVTGLIVALGLLVDSAIVMTDEIRKSMAAGFDRAVALRIAVRRLAAPLLASTVTTALAFMPMVLLPGPAGDFVGSIAIAVIVMLVWSFLIAMTVTPAIAGWLLPEPERNGSRGFWRHGLRGGLVARFFRQTLVLAIRHPRLGVLYALILPVMGFLSFPTLTAQFFPGVDRDQFYVEIEMPAGTAIARTDALVQKIDAALAGENAITGVTWVVGESAPAFYYNMVTNRDSSPDYAQALVTTQSEDATAALIPGLQERLNAGFPEARILVRDLVQGPPVDAPVELRFVGPDLGVLTALGEEARRIMDSVEETSHVRTTVGSPAPKLEFVLDEDKVRLTGLDLASVAAQFDAHLQGVTGGSLIEGTEELPVRVRLGEGDRSDPGFIQTLDILAPADRTDPTAGYRGIPATALGDMRLVPAEPSINRRNGERTNTVQGFVQYGVLPEEALKKVQAALDASGFALPDGYRLELGGDSDARGETMRNLLASVGLIVTLTIAAIVLTFNSFRLSLVAGAVAILSAGLSLLALAIFQYPFGIQGVIGVIGSIGVSINAAIIIMTALQADEGAVAGNHERIVDVVMGASRHIVSTTITTFGGFLPLILEGGGFWPPFAMSIAGGVLLSTVVSFYFTPPMFALVYAKRPPKAEDAMPERLERSGETAMKPVLMEAAE
ncbi:MAG: efflux RND transporter permease subunit [Pseudomonadota bacterium]